MNTAHLLAVCAAAGVAAASLSPAVIAQTKPAEPAKPAAKDDAAAAPKAAPAALDPEIKALHDLLAGRYVAAERTFNIVPVTIPDTPGALFCEITRAGRENEPEAHVIFQFIKRRDSTYLRMYRFPGGGTIAPGVASVPQAFPEFEGARLDLLTDLPVESDNPLTPTTFIAKTKDPIPTNTSGAVDMTSQFKVDKDGLMVYEVGYNAEGKDVWAFPIGDRVVFKRDKTPNNLEVRPSGLIIDDYKPATDPNAREGKPGDSYTVHYRGWLPSGVMFDTSRQEGRQPFDITIPGGVIAGWNEGLIGMKVGSSRRLYIPPALGYGARGAGGVIPANSWLVFDIELLDLKKPEAPPPSTPKNDPGSNAGRPVDPVKDADKAVDKKKPE